MILDYTSSFDYVLALLPEVVISIWGMLVLLMGVMRKRGSGQGQAIGWMAVAGLGLAAVANGWLYTGVIEDGAAAMIALDRFRFFANWIFILAAALSIVISFASVCRTKLQVGE